MRGALVGIVGPTATGKTAVGLKLAERLDGEIISADSMAVYRGMDIGTAKPTPLERASCPFHLIDVVNPDEEFSVAEYKRRAETAVDEIVQRGRLPILVGGTGLYVKALCGGLNIPAVPPDKSLRRSLASEAEQMGGEYILAKLRKVDPESAARLHPRDTKRIIRAIEVYTATGKPISEFHRGSDGQASPRHVMLYGLTMNRERLYARIEERIDRQMQSGLLEEVRALLAKGYSPDLPAMKGLGYKHLAAFLAGTCSLDEAVSIFKRDTRRFAKRQLTWFGADSSIVWIDVEGRSPADIAEQIAEAAHNEASASEHS